MDKQSNYEPGDTENYLSNLPGNCGENPAGSTCVFDCPAE